MQKYNYNALMFRERYSRTQFIKKYKLGSTSDLKSIAKRNCNDQQIMNVKTF